MPVNQFDLISNQLRIEQELKRLKPMQATTIKPTNSTRGLGKFRNPRNGKPLKKKHKEN